MSFKNLKERIQKEISDSTSTTEINAFKHVLEMIDEEPKETAYLISDGSYSDYRITGVYLDEDLAKEAQEYYNANNYIEEYKVDEAVPEHPAGKFCWFVLMKRDGEVLSAHQRGHSPERESCIDYNGNGQFEMWAADKEHAIKIANERRAMMIANGEWGN